ncbi:MULTISPECIES: hypothetical protein [unclassified Nocardioides]|uniref:hypothetical protein n=1 Tax=unclassified Nocardioides TaxID=2615069 RepID=UPI003608D1EE
MTAPGRSSGMQWPPAVLAALATAALIAARLLAISRFDVNTAAMILQVSGTGTALAGTALTLLPPALFGATLFLAVVAFLDDSLLSTGVPNAWLLTFALAATVCLTPLPFAVATLALVGTIWLAGWGLRRSRGAISIRAELRGSRMLRVLLMVLVVLLALAPLVLQRPWLPLQALTLEDDTVVVGYVLGKAEGRVVVMSDRDRTITLIDPKDISAREICQGGAQPGGVLSDVPQVTVSGSALGLLLWGDETPSYPVCPDPD